MRLVSTLNDQKAAGFLSSFLASEGIENQLEIFANTDWGSPKYGDVVCKLWVIDEDQVEAAMRWIETYSADPNREVFRKFAHGPVPVSLPPPSPAAFPKIKLPLSQPPAAPQDSMGTITATFLLICCALFILSLFTAPAVTSIPAKLPATPFVDSQIKKEMLYDYPYAFEILDTLIRLYGPEKVQDSQSLPKEGQLLLQKFDKTPYWQGFYDIIIHKLQRPGEPVSVNAPLFEKIKEGEVWRLFTPCLLHYDILHILFNMIWLVILGKQMEKRLPASRYLFFILIAGIFSNTCQYLMSGANFIGFSGILCAMLTFIWMRQRVAAWEGYPLERSTFLFMMVFIFAMFFIQAVSFYLEYGHKISISPGIANTAHLSGAALGALLGRIPLFSWKA